MPAFKRGKNLPNECHVIRHVPFQRLRRDGDDNVIGFLPEAFQLRPEELSLSVNLLEYCEGSRSEQVAHTVRSLRTAKHIKPSTKCAFGIGNVGVIADVASKYTSQVRIVFAPTAGIPSHSEIRKLPRDDFELLDALAADAFLEIVHNVDVSESPS